MGSKTGLMKKLLIIMIILLFLFPVAYCGFIFIYDSVISENISSPHFCVDDDKNVYMVWGSDSDDDGLEDRIHFRKVDKNGDTKTDKIIIETSKPSFEPRILLDSNDNLHLLWFKIQGSFESGYLPYDADLYHKKLDLDGGEITSDKKVNSGKYRIHGFDDFSRLRMDDYDNIHIIGDDIGFLILNNAGTIIYSNSKYNRPGSDFIINSDNNIHIFYSIESEWGIFYDKLSFINNSVKYVDTRLIFAENGQAPQVQRDKQDRIHIFFSDVNYSMDRAHADCYRILDPDGNQIYEKREFEPYPYYTSFDFDSENNMVLITTHYDSEGVHLYFTKLDNNGTILSEKKEFLLLEDQLPVITDPVLFNLNIYIDMDDDIHLLWYINNGDNTFTLQYASIDNDGDLIDSNLLVYPEYLVCSLPILIIVEVLLLVITIIVYVKKRKMKEEEPDTDDEDHDDSDKTGSELK